MTGLKESQMRLLLAYVFTRHGYSARGTTLLTEHGTAAIREALARLLHDRTGGLIRVRESGITGREQAIAGMLPGRGNGNFRFKAGLESLRNLIHNELGALPAQTGKDVEHRPERLHGELQYCTDLARAIARRPKHVQERLAELVRYPVLEYHTQFLPALALVYGLINERTEHALEGWHACGHVAVDYRLSPAHDVWLGPAEYLALPAPSRALLAQLAQAEPETYCRQRLLSPQEVFNAGSRHLQPLAPSIVAEMLGPDLAREATVRGGYFEVAEAEAHPEPMRFEARVADDQGREAELREGEKYSVLVNPFDLSALWVTDARGRFLGVAKRVVRVRRDDEEALREAYGRRNRRLADLLRPVRGRHTEVTREAMAREAHNARVLSGEPITQAELHTAEREARTAADDATDLLAGASGGAERPARQEHTTDAPEAADVWSEVLGEDTNYDRE